MMALLFFLLGLLLGCLGLLFWWLAHTRRPITLHRLPHNPVLQPRADYWWESQAVFNPAAVYVGGRVHLLYRALGNDGVSRVGYASSKDGIHFDERLPYPVFEPKIDFATYRQLRHGPMSYNTDAYASGGSWGGSEDPRAVVIEEEVYMSFGVIESWQSMRMAITSLPTKNLENQAWQWAPHVFISPPGVRNKNWVLFPDKINGKFGILHALTPEVLVDYFDSLEDLYQNPIMSNNNRQGTDKGWESFIRGAAAPPIKTSEGWLLLYHANDKTDPHKYKVGALLLDLRNPTKVLYRSSYPILEPAEWYENDWKPGVVYASGAVVVGDDLLVYYGSGDKYVAVAKANLNDFLHKLTSNQHAELEPVAVYGN